MSTTNSRQADMALEMGERPPRWHFMLGTAGCIALIVLGAWIHYRRDEAETRRRVTAELGAIADLKMGEIANWRNERMGDARFFGRAPFVARDVQALLADPQSEATRAAARTWMNLLKGGARYSQVALLTPDGDPLLAVPETMLERKALLLGYVAETLRNREVTIHDLHTDDGEPGMHMNVSVPIFPAAALPALGQPPLPEAAPIAVLVLRLDPHQFLFPLVQKWPLPRATGEVSLVRREGDEVLVLNERRHRRSTALKTRFPISSTERPSAIALRQGHGVIEERDDRGELVLTAYGAVPDSPWWIGVKIDQGEVFAPLRREALLTGIAALSLSLATIGAFAWLMRRREAGLMQHNLAADAARRESDARFAGLVRSAMDAIVSVDEEQRIVLFNPAAERMFGHREAEMLGQPLDRLLPGQFRESHRRQVEQFGAGGESRRRFGGVGNVFGLRANGEQFPVEVSISREAAGGRTYHSAILRDITERVRAENELREREARLRNLGDNLPSGIIYQLVIEPDGRKRFVYLSSGVEQLFGLPAARVLADPGEFWNLIVEEDRPLLAAAEEKSAREFSLFDAEFRQRTVLGEVKWINARSSPHRLAGGAVVWDGVAVDITDRKRAEAALREREEQLALFVEHAPAAIAMFDREMNYLVVSRRWFADYGLAGREVRGRSHYEIFPEIPERWKAIHRRCLAGAVERVEEDCLTRPDGREQWLRWEARPWYSAPGVIGGIIVFSEDITGRKLGQQALEQSQRRFQELAEHVTEVFWVTDLDGRVLYVNPAYEKVWGRSCESVQADPGSWIAAIHPEDRARVEEGLRVRLPAGTFDETYRITRPDGAERWVHDHGHPVRDAAGNVVHYVGVVQDVTASRALEAQFLQAQKMEAIGRLAGGVAHDFNNMLSAITMQTDLLASALPDGDPLRASLHDIRRAADRAASLTRQLLVFSRQEVVEPRVLDLNAAVADSEKMLRRLIGEDVLLETMPGPGLRAVKIDPGQLGQVIMNLAVNARDAMPQGGRLTIGTDNVELDEAYTRTQADVRPGRYVLLAVSDTGCGMTPAVLARIWEPFFTTKPAGRGSGLGLAVVHGIVKQAGGHLVVYSEVGIGTTFKIYLPAVAEAPHASTGERADAVRGSETVLLVDDEESFRRIAAAALQHLGYKVLAAPDGEQALKTADTHPGRIDLLLTDVVMPGIGGRAVAEQLQARRPGLRVLYQSGYTDDAVVRHGVLQDEVAFLQKPVTLVELASKVREVLDEA